LSNGGDQEDEEDEENLTSKKISDKINNMIVEGLVDIKVKRKFEFD
jgi:hypothetical protein